MSIQKEKPKAIYEPGELDKTRKNLGEISPEEAMSIAQKLGGEIGVEKAKDFSAAFAKKSKRYVKRGDAPLVKTEQFLNEAETNKTQKKDTKDPKKTVEKPFSTSALPMMKVPARKLLDTIMMSNEYRIKTNYGFFSFVVQAMRRNQEKVSPQFITYTLKQYILNIQKMARSVQNMLSYTRTEFKQELIDRKTHYHKVIALISEWNTKDLENEFKKIDQDAKNICVVKLIPLTKTLFRLLLPIYYLGEDRIISYIKQIYTENAPFVSGSKEKFMHHTKEAASQWIYIYGQVFKGMYPLLLRMTSNDFVEYPAFYVKRSAEILIFLGLSKFDILLPEKTETEENTTKTETKIETEQKEEPVKDAIPVEEKEEKPEERIDSILVAKGLDVLDTLFPDAGWKDLSSKPDLYPYFQPIYNFADGFNLLAPTNPMQVTIILHRILEDFFQALRNIKYSIDKEPEFSIYNDSISAVFSQWSTYREYEFERLYLPKLKEYVNQAYTQSDFVKTNYAKKLISNFFWQTKYHFLPHISFELIFMEKPDKDSDLIPLPNRISFLKQVYKTLVNRVEQNKNISLSEDKTKNDDIFGAQNLFQEYRFDIPNAISKRVDILLNKKKGVNANNLNLIKYTLFILAVLDWWVNNKESPANSEVAQIPYRTSQEDGSPVFYVTERSDLDRIFINNIKSKMQNKKQTT